MHNTRTSKSSCESFFVELIGCYEIKKKYYHKMNKEWVTFSCLHLSFHLARPSRLPKQHLAQAADIFTVLLTHTTAPWLAQGSMRINGCLPTLSLRKWQPFHLFLSMNARKELFTCYFLKRIPENYIHIIFTYYSGKLSEKKASFTFYFCKTNQ